MKLKQMSCIKFIVLFSICQFSKQAIETILTAMLSFDCFYLRPDSTETVILRNEHKRLRNNTLSKVFFLSFYWFFLISLNTLHLPSSLIT